MSKKLIYLIAVAGLSFPATVAFADNARSLYAAPEAVKQMHEPDSDDPTAEFPLIFVVSNDNKTYDFVVEKLDALGLDAYVCLTDNPVTENELKTTARNRRIDMDRVYIIADRDCQAAYAASILTIKDVDDLTDERIIALFEQIKGY